MSSTCFIIRLHPQGDGPPGEVRLKRLMKSALRAFGLRCELVEVADSAGSGPATEAVSACAHPRADVRESEAR